MAEVSQLMRKLPNLSRKLMGPTNSSDKHKYYNVLLDYHFEVDGEDNQMYGLLCFSHKKKINK